MKYQHKCACCGHTTTAYSLPLNEGLARAFCVFAKLWFWDHKPIKKGALGLTNSQYANFQNLRHFGIIAQAEKGGGWNLTPDGISFYLGKKAIFTPAGHMGGVTLTPFHPAWATHDKQREPITIADILPDDWKQRAEYREEKSAS